MMGCQRPNAAVLVRRKDKPRRLELTDREQEDASRRDLGNSSVQTANGTENRIALACEHPRILFSGGRPILGIVGPIACAEAKTRLACTYVKRLQVKSTGIRPKNIND